MVANGVAFFWVGPLQGTPTTTTMQTILFNLVFSWLKCNYAPLFTYSLNFSPSIFKTSFFILLSIKLTKFVGRPPI